MDCQHCKELEAATLALWMSLFPGEKWIDALTALVFMRLEYRSKMDDAKAKLDALEDVEANREKEVSEFAATMLPVMQLIQKRLIDKVPPKPGYVRIVFRNPMEVLRVRDAIAISLTDERVKELVYKGQADAELTADAYACVLSWLMFDKVVGPVFDENLGIIDRALKLCGYELITEEPE